MQLELICELSRDARQVYTRGGFFAMLFVIWLPMFVASKYLPRFLALLTIYEVASQTHHHYEHESGVRASIETFFFGHGHDTIASETLPRVPSPIARLKRLMCVGVRQTES